MTINAKRLFLGGIAAGAVIIVGNLAANLVLGSRVQEDLNAWIPGAAAEATTGEVTVVAGLVLKFVIGVLLVAGYAAIRPRFGPGAKTAVYSAVFVWMLGAVFFSDYLILGMMSAATYAVVELLQLVSFLVAGLVGARLYAERPAYGS